MKRTSAGLVFNLKLETLNLNLFIAVYPFCDDPCIPRGVK